MFIFRFHYFVDLFVFYLFYLFSSFFKFYLILSSPALVSIDHLHSRLIKHKLNKQNKISCYIKCQILKHEHKVYSINLKVAPSSFFWTTLPFLNALIYNLTLAQWIWISYQMLGLDDSFGRCSFIAKKKQISRLLSVLSGPLQWWPFSTWLE